MEALDKADDLYKKHAGEPLPAAVRAAMSYAAIYVASELQIHLILALEEHHKTLLERNALLDRLAKLEGGESHG